MTFKQKAVKTIVDSQNKIREKFVHFFLAVNESQVICLRTRCAIDECKLFINSEFFIEIIYEAVENKMTNNFVRMYRIIYWPCYENRKPNQFHSFVFFVRSTVNEFLPTQKSPRERAYINSNDFIGNVQCDITNEGNKIN